MKKTIKYQSIVLSLFTRYITPFLIQTSDSVSHSQGLSSNPYCDLNEFNLSYEYFSFRIHSNRLFSSTFRSSLFPGVSFPLFHLLTFGKHIYVLVTRTADIIYTGCSKSTFYKVWGGLLNSIHQ